MVPLQEENKPTSTGRLLSMTVYDWVAVNEAAVYRVAVYEVAVYESECL